jgi:hypothetical protein
VPSHFEFCASATGELPDLHLLDADQIESVSEGESHDPGSAIGRFLPVVVFCGTRPATGA